MFHHWSLLSIFVTIFLLKISNIHSNPMKSDISSHIIDENIDNQNIQNTLRYLIKNILDEPYSSEQLMLLNQLREYLNRMCIMGYFGSTHGHSCQRIFDIIHQYDINNDDNINLVHDNINNEQHGLQKRFFCNGFIGCKSAGR